MAYVDLCSQSQKTDRTSGSLDSKSMGVATWKTPVQPLMASSKLPSTARSAFHKDRRSVAPGRSSNGFVFLTFAGGHDTTRHGANQSLAAATDGIGRTATSTQDETMQLTGIARRRPDGVAGLEELHDEPGADEARRPRDHHRPFRARASVHRRLPRCYHLRHFGFLL